MPLDWDIYHGWLNWPLHHKCSNFGRHSSQGDIAGHMCSNVSNILGNISHILYTERPYNGTSGKPCRIGHLQEGSWRKSSRNRHFLSPKNSFLTIKKKITLASTILEWKHKVAFKAKIWVIRAVNTVRIPARSALVIDDWFPIICYTSQDALTLEQSVASCAVHALKELSIETVSLTNTAIFGAGHAEVVDAHCGIRAAYIRKSLYFWRKRKWEAHRKRIHFNCTGSHMEFLLHLKGRAWQVSQMKV